jgi:hypothetical protein
MTLQALTSVYGSQRANALQVTKSAHLADPSQEKKSGLLFHIRKAIAIHEETIRRLLILVALYAIPAVMVMRPVLDPDIWWHLRTGQWIIEHGAVPQTDPFSIYGIGKVWIAYSWLFEILVYGLYQWLGLTGILFYRVVLFLAVTVAVHRFVAKHEPRFVVAIGIVGLALFAMTPALSERPWLFTILFFTLTLNAVLDLREGVETKAVWLLPPMYAIWANIHIQFIYGLFVLALACAAPFIDRLFQSSKWGDNAATVGSRGWWKLAALTGVCFAATLLNPYHVSIYAVVVDYATQLAPYRYVQELTALDFRAPSHWAVLAITGAGAFVLGRRGKHSAFEILLFAAAAWCAFRAKRDVWFMALAAATIMATAGSTATLPDRFRLTKLRALFVAAMVVTVLVVVGRIWDISERHLEARLAETYPVAAATIVEEHGYPGPLYNHFNWGGYLIWRLPSLPVAMDGRTNLHGDARIERSLATWAGKNGWASDRELVASHMVISGVDWPLASLLRLDPRFELVYKDAVAAVFIARQQPQGQ